MSDNLKYYYMRLKEDFFDSDEIKILEGMQNGYKYSNLLLKLYLKSLKLNGALRLNEFIPYDPKMIASVCNMDIDTVMVALELYQKLGLVEIMGDGTIYMLQIQALIGKSSTEADRKMEYRRKIEQEKVKLLGQMSDESPQELGQRPPEIDIEIELELEKEKEIEIEPQEPPTPASEPEPKKGRKKKEKALDDAEKVKYADYVSMTEEEYLKLNSEYGKAAATRMIEILNSYKGSSGKSYKNDYLAIKNWVVERVKEEFNKTKKPFGAKMSFNDQADMIGSWLNSREGSET